jgi:hypothetical protein
MFFVPIVTTMFMFSGFYWITLMLLADFIEIFTVFFLKVFYCSQSTSITETSHYLFKFLFSIWKVENLFACSEGLSFIFLPIWGFRKICETLFKLLVDKINYLKVKIGFLKFFGQTFSCRRKWLLRVL